MNAHDWLKLGSIGTQAFTFSACVRWVWKHQNLVFEQRDLIPKLTTFQHPEHGRDLQIMFFR
jgi:hypothetical protein